MTCPPLIHDKCPCGNPLDLAVDHGDTPEGFPICSDCCPDCNPKGPTVNEPVHKITYQQTHTSILTREAIEDRANNPQNYKRELVEACRQWLAEHPEPLTREQLDRLPPGTVITNAGADIGTENYWVVGADGHIHIAVVQVENNGQLADCFKLQTRHRPQGVFVPLTETQIRAVDKWLVVQPNDQDAVNAARRFVAACREATA